MPLSDIGSLLKQKVDAFIMKEITLSASNLAETAKNNASWSKKIPSAISVSEAQTDGSGKYWIDIKVDLNKAPQAAAFEYGSGIHKKENSETYPITPKQASALAFNWPGHGPPWGSRKFIGIADDGRFLFTNVDHPGVVARPYLAPAIESNKKTIRDRLLRAFVSGYKEVIVQFEKIE